MKNTEVSRVSFYSNLLMILTSAHHAYGAIVYATPWRLHVLLISVPVIIITEVLKRLIDREMNTARNLIIWLYWIIVFVFSVLLIGIFEGLYNHLLKNILYLSGASKETLYSLFPPPTYVMPDDFLFELTGVLQGVVAIPLLIWITRMTRNIFNK